MTDPDKVTLYFDGRPVEADPGWSVLEAARQAGVFIPAVCHHPALKPVGSCKVCVVEVPTADGPRVVLSCLTKVRDGLEVATQSDRVRKARNEAFENLLRMAPTSKRLLDLARRSGVPLSHLPDGCIRCRLCVRVCRDVVGPAALKLTKQDGATLIVPIADRCIGCGTCANVCPTGAIQVVDRDDLRTITIRDQIIGQHHLTRCELCGRMFATEKFLDRVSHRAADRHPDVKEHHAYCPTCERLGSFRVRSSEHMKVR
jgi:predicted molibdopterin-dependent oxidoreductase YjgC